MREYAFLSSISLYVGTANMFFWNNVITYFINNSYINFIKLTYLLIFNQHIYKFVTYVNMTLHTYMQIHKQFESKLKLLRNYEKKIFTL